MVHRYLSVEKYKIMQQQTDRIPKLSEVANILHRQMKLFKESLLTHENRQD